MKKTLIIIFVLLVALSSILFYLSRVNKHEQQMSSTNILKSSFTNLFEQIEKFTSKGMSDTEITNTLKGQGYSPAVIDDVIGFCSAIKAHPEFFAQGSDNNSEIPQEMKEAIGKIIFDLQK